MSDQPQPDRTQADSDIAAAIEHRQAGRLDAAITLLARVAQEHAGVAEAHFQLGLALAAAGRALEAARSLQQAFLLQPDRPDILCNLGMTLGRLTQFDTALVCHERAIALAPNDAQLHFALAGTLYLKRDMAGAVKANQAAVFLAPDMALGWTGLGECLAAAGRYDEAVPCFRRALELEPDQVEAYRGLAAARQLPKDQAEQDRFANLLQRADLPVAKRITIGFAHGAMLDHAGQFDDAFASFATANALVRANHAAAGRSFNASALHRQYDQLIAAFTPETFARTAGWGNPSELPVFIVGMARSGSSLIEQIIASHRQAIGVGESPAIGQLAVNLANVHRGRGFRDWAPEIARRHADGYVAQLTALAGDATRVVDKMLDNFVHLGLIAALLPNARVIISRRDPRDVCLSCYFQHFSDGNPYAYDLVDCARRLREMDRLITHWQAVLPLRMLEVDYETLIDDLPGESRRLIDFLGLDWDPACLEFHRTERAVVTSSAWQVRQPAYASSIGRWRHYERHIGKLLAELDAPG